MAQAQGQGARAIIEGRKGGSVTYSTDPENEVRMIFPTVRPTRNGVEFESKTLNIKSLARFDTQFQK